ncbi:MAG: hypothetical protein PUD36_09795 [Bacteroidales bacterium]|nr:hypothetical protein [Bacteroidales bacterium]
MLKEKEISILTLALTVCLSSCGGNGGQNNGAADGNGEVKTDSIPSENTETEPDASANVPYRYVFDFVDEQNTLTLKP